jgi:hypothetical protein
MREFFKDTKFRADSMALIQECDRITQEYLADGLTMTVRQLYYQLVSANSVPNDEKSYNRVKGIVSKARLAGMIDWAAIEDRARQAEEPSEWGSINSIVNSALRSFRLPRLKGQSEYVELWVEKDALAGVLEPVARRYHVVLMVNRGYSSQSAMYESANRINRNIDQYNCDDATILYLGDLDPSGEDMVRDINERMEMFGCYASVEKVALNMDQVQRYSLPPNPAKLSDSRAAAFIAKYGTSSWEVDAIPPRVLQRLISDAIEERLDMGVMQEIIDKETEDKRRLSEAMKGLDDDNTEEGDTDG